MCVIGVQTTIIKSKINSHYAQKLKKEDMRLKY